MHPTLFRIGGFHVATYGVVMAVAIMAAGWLVARGFRERDLPEDEAWNLLWFGLLGGLLGAKLYYAALHGPENLLSRSGMVWYGGFLGGIGAVAVGIRLRGLPFRGTLDVLAPALALGHGIGHIGCFFSGDSYGLPSDLPWAVGFPRGAPPSTAHNLRHGFGVEIPAGVAPDTVLSVHPTMLYSAAALLLIAGFLWWRRHGSGAPGRLFALYLVLTGTERFLVEFIRAKDDRILWGMSTAQAIALALVVTGALVLLRLRGQTRAGDAVPSTSSSDDRSDRVARAPAATHSR